LQQHAEVSIKSRKTAARLWAPLNVAKARISSIRVNNTRRLHSRQRLYHAGFNNMNGAVLANFSESFVAETAPL
jgi:hypothetical protein